MKKNKFVIIISLFILILLIFVIFKGKKKGGIKVAVEKVSERKIIETVSASGVIYPQNEVKISADVSGEIVDMYVLEGDTVKKGQLLFKINPDIYITQLDQSKAGLNASKANLANIEAQLNSAKSNYLLQEKIFDRQKQLLKDKVTSQQEFEQAENQLKVSQANLESAEKQALSALYNTRSVEASVQQSSKSYNRTMVYAPESGIITGLNSKIGERVVGTAQMAGTDIMRISDLSKMEVRVDVNENDVVRIKVGDSCDVEVDAYQNKKFKGIVSMVANSAKNSGNGFGDQATKFEVKILLLANSYEDLIIENSGRIPFRPGMNASVQIQTKVIEKILSVPVSSVTMKEKLENTDEKEQVVFVLENNIVKKRVVKTGIQDIGYIQVLEGLKKEETVVSFPYHIINFSLKEGDKVKVVNKEEVYKNE